MCAFYTFIYFISTFFIYIICICRIVSAGPQEHNAGIHNLSVMSSTATWPSPKASKSPTIVTSTTSSTYVTVFTGRNVSANASSHDSTAIDKDVTTVHPPYEKTKNSNLVRKVSHKPAQLRTRNNIALNGFRNWRGRDIRDSKANVLYKTKRNNAFSNLEANWTFRRVLKPPGLLSIVQVNQYATPQNDHEFPTFENRHRHRSLKLLGKNFLLRPNSRRARYHLRTRQLHDTKFDYYSNQRRSNFLPLYHTLSSTMKSDLSPSISHEKLSIRNQSLDSQSEMEYSIANTDGDITSLGDQDEKNGNKEEQYGHQKKQYGCQDVKDGHKIETYEYQNEPFYNKKNILSPQREVNAQQGEVRSPQEENSKHLHTELYHHDEILKSENKGNTSNWFNSSGIPDPGAHSMLQLKVATTDVKTEAKKKNVTKKTDEQHEIRQVRRILVSDGSQFKVSRMARIRDLLHRSNLSFSVTKDLKNLNERYMSVMLSGLHDPSTLFLSQGKINVPLNVNIVRPYRNVVLTITFFSKYSM